MNYVPGKPAGTYDHKALPCAVCEVTLAFYRPYKSTMPFRCTQCGADEHGNKEPAAAAASTVDRDSTTRERGPGDADGGTGTNAELAAPASPQGASCTSPGTDAVAPTQAQSVPGGGSYDEAIALALRTVFSEVVGAELPLTNVHRHMATRMVTELRALGLDVCEVQK